MKKLMIALLIAAIALVAGCGGGGGGGNKGGGGGSTDTIVRGRVVDNYTTPRAVAGVQVTLGPYTTTTAADGRFSFNLGANVPVSTVVPGPTYVFKVSTHLLPPDQYDDFPVTYLSVEYEQALDGTGASIPLPFEVLATTGATADLGTITVKWIDPNSPPPPPF